jgi:hypothetical protein
MPNQSCMSDLLDEIITLIHRDDNSDLDEIEVDDTKLGYHIKIRRPISIIKGE